MAKVKVDDINSGSASTKTTTTPTNKNTNTSKQLSGVKSVVTNVNTSSNTVNKITSSGKVTTPTTTTTKTSGTSVSPYTSSKQPTSTLSTTLDTTNKVGSSTPSMQTVLDNGTKVETKTTPTLDVNNISLSGGRTVAPTQKETTTQENKINQVDASKGKTVAPTEESNKSAQAQLNNIVSQEAKENIEKTREEVNNYSQGHYAWSDDQYNLERLADETENYSRAYNDNLTKFNAEVEKYNNGQSSYSYDQMVQMENELNSQREDLISRINKTQETQDEFVQKYTNSSEIYKDYQTEYDDISKQINDKEVELIQNANKPYEERKDISSELQSLKKKKEEIEEKIKQQDKLKQVNYYDYLQQYGSDEEIASYNKQLAAEDDLLIQRVNHMLQAATVGLANGFVQSGTLLTEVVDAVSGKNNYDPLSNERLANKLSALQNDLNSYVLAGTDGAYKWGLNSINSLMPFVVTLIATKGLNSVANLGLSSDAIGTLGTHLQGMQVGSSTAMENLKNGESLETSLLQGGIMGAISILTETLGGEGFVNLITSDVGQYFAGLTAKEMVKLTTSDVIYSTIESALSEGTEEIMEKAFDSIGNHLVNVITGSNFDTGFNNGDTLENNLLTYVKESANEFAMSFFGSLFYGGYASTKGAIQNNKQYQAALQLMEKADQRIYQLEKMKAELSDELSQQGINIDKNIEEWKATQSVLKDNIKVYEDKSITSEKITEATNEKLATYEESASALIESMKNDVQSIIDTYEKVQADYIQSVGLEYTLLKRAGVNLNGGLEAYENLDESEKENVYKMSKDTQEFAQELRKKIIFESSEQIREYASKNSGVQKLGQVDGYYNPSDNTYHIATSNTSDIISEIIAHELTHGIEKSASYSRLSELVLTKLLQDNNYTLKENETLWDNPITKQELKKYGKLYEKAGVENANAQSELIAKLVQKEFNNKGFDSLIKYLKDDGIKGYITRKFYDITSGLSKDISKQIENTFNKANYELEMDLREKNLNSNNPSMYSLSSLFGACGLDIAKNENGMIDVEYNGESVKEVTVDMVKDSPLGNLLVADVQHEFITQEEADKQANAFAQLLNMIKSTQSPDLIWAISSGLGFNEANVGDNLSDLKNTVSHALTSNADHQYSSTFDVTTICLKTQQIINVMSELMVKLQRGLTENEIINTVFKEVYNSGESVPCPVCYVFSRWVGLGGLLNNIYTYQNEYENIDVKELEKEFAELEKEVEKIIANSTKKLSGTDARNILRDMLEEESETYIALINEQSQLVNQKSLDLLAKKDFNAQAKLDEVNHKLELMDRWSWIKNVRLNPEYETKGKVDPNVLFNINAGEEFANRFPLAWKYRTTRGAAMGKAVTPYVSEVLGQTIYGASSKNALNKLGQYRTTEKNEFLKGSLTKKAKDRIDLAIKKAKAQNLLGGQRYQSTSDFRFEYVTDYLLHFFELQSIGSYSQGYTKVAEAVSFLASMGAEVNCSLMPLGNGFDKYGNLAFSSVTGMNPDDAFRLSSMYDNVQPIMVGINDDHIIACMKDDRITFIIPYHASGSTEARLLAMMQIVGERINPKDRKSYEKSQNDEVIDESLANVRELRLKILTHKVGTLTQEQRSILANNSYLENLYERFYGERYDGTKVETIDDKCYQVALNKDQAEKIMPFEYWDTSLTIKDANENGRRFVEYCKSLGLKPRFEQFSTYDGYWKLLIDRSMYNVDGTYHEQKPINVSNFSSDMFLRSKMVKGIVQPSKQVDNTKTQTIVDNSLRRLQMDIAETDSDGNPISNQMAERNKHSVIRDANGNLLVMYHGTDAYFDAFDIKQIGRHGSYEGTGFNFTPSESRAKGYGAKNLLKGYLNITNPISSKEITMSANELADIIKKADPTGDKIISNYATDVKGYGTKEFVDREALNTAKALMEYHDNDADIYSDLSSTSSNTELMDIYKSLGYDGIIQYYEDGKIQTAVAFSPNQFKAIENQTPTNDDRFMFDIGNGYDGYSMSNNARAAYLSGEMPESKWTKEKIIREVNNYVNEYKNILNVNEEAISMLPKLRKNELFRLVLSNKGWHHTSEYYNETMFWGISRDKLEELTPEKINNIIANRTNKVVEENPIRKGTIKYLEWGGTRQHPIAYPQTLKGNIQEKGSFYIVTDDNGRQLLRKKIGSNGTSVEYDDIKFDIPIKDALQETNRFAENKAISNATKIVSSDAIKNFNTVYNEQYRGVLDRIQTEQRRMERKLKTEELATEIITEGQDLKWFKNYLTVEQALDKILTGESRKYGEQITLERQVAQEYRNKIREVEQDIIDELVKLGIYEGSKESELLQAYIEQHTNEIIEEKISETESQKKWKPYTLQDLKRDTPNWKTIVEASQVLQDELDTLIGLVNESQFEVYGIDDTIAEAELDLAKMKAKMQEASRTIDILKQKMFENPSEQIKKAIDKAYSEYNTLVAKYDALFKDHYKGQDTRRRLTPRRNNYMHHIPKDTFKNRLKSVMADTSIPSKLVGLTEFTKPNTTWSGFMAEQGLGDYEMDAIKSFASYVNDASRVIAYNPYVASMRALVQQLRDIDSNNDFNNTIDFFENHTNDVVGKRNNLDRFIDNNTPSGFRKGLMLVTSIAKVSALKYNFRTGLTQFANIPNGLGVLERYGGAKYIGDIGKGLGKAIGEIIAKKPKTVNNSTFVTARYFDFNTGEKGIKATSDAIANWIMSIGDEIGTKVIWYSAFAQAERLGKENKYAYADDITRRSVAGRDIGEVPTMLKTSLLNFLAPFQIETNNAWQTFIDNVSNKRVGALLTTGVASYLFNQFIRMIGLNDDVLTSFITPFVNEIGKYVKKKKDDDEENDITVAELISNIIRGELGELLSAMPFGSQVMSIVTTNEKAKNFFGEDYNPSRYGNVQIGLKGLSNIFDDAISGNYVEALNDFISSYVNTQLMRSVNGLQSVGILPKYEQSTKSWETNTIDMTPSGNVRFINEQTVGNILKAFFFGKWSTDAAQEYLDSGYKTWSKTDTNIYKTIDKLGGENAIDIAKTYTDANELKTSLQDIGIWDDYVEQVASDYMEYLDNDGDKSFSQFIQTYGLNSETTGGNETFNYYKYSRNMDDDTRTKLNEIRSLDGIYKDENGKIYDSKVDGATKVSNSEALETRKALQDIGQYESVLDYIAENGLEYSDFGLSKTVVNYDDSKFNKAYNKVFGTTDTESNKDTTGTKSNNKTSSTGSTQSSSNGNKTSGSTSSTNTTTNSTNTTTSGTSTTKNLDTGKVSAKSTPSVGSKGSSSKVAAEETTSGGSSTMSLGKQNYGSIDLLKKNQSYWEWLLENGLA